MPDGFKPDPTKPLCRSVDGQLVPWTRGNDKEIRPRPPTKTELIGPKPTTRFVIQGDMIVPADD